MALASTSSESYVRTGESSEFGLTRFFAKAADWTSFIPVPGLNTVLTGLFGGLSTFSDVVYNLVRLRPLSAATAWAAGSASTLTNVTVSAGAFLNPIWWADVAQGVVTGRAAGTHARAAVETVVGGVTGALGIKPDVLQSYTVGVGSIGSDMAMPQQMPSPADRQFTSKIAGERGQNADALWDQKMRGETGVHMNELQSANMGR